MITFYRRPEPDVTEYFLLPLNQEIIELIIANYCSGQSHSLDVVYGKTKKHPKDKGDRKIGKEEAQKKSKKTRLNIDQITMNEKYVYLRLILDNSIIMVKMTKDTGRIMCL